MERDGSLAGDDDDFEVAAASFDLFDAYADALRPFFSAVVRSETVRWFSVPAAGLDHPVFTMVLQRGARLTNAHVTDIPISEYVLPQVLDHYRGRALVANTHARSAWDRHENPRGRGLAVADRGPRGDRRGDRDTGAGVRRAVTGCRRHPTGDEPIDAYVGPTDLVAVLPEADVVVLSLPGEIDAPPLVDAAFLAAMAEGSMLINIARGSLVDEVALVAALDRGRPEVAVLDVMVTEPLPSDSPLWTHHTSCSRRTIPPVAAIAMTGTTTCWSTTSVVTPGASRCSTRCSSLEELAGRVVGQHLAAGLAGRAVVDLVGAVLDTSRTVSPHTGHGSPVRWWTLPGRSADELMSSAAPLVGEPLVDALADRLVDRPAPRRTSAWPSRRTARAWPGGRPRWPADGRARR